MPRRPATELSESSAASVLWLKSTPRFFMLSFADAFGTVAAKEGAVIEEELQQVEIRCAQLTAEEKIVAQPRVEVFDE